MIYVSWKGAFTVSDEPVRINVLFPADVADDLRDLVPPRQRSRFIVEAVGGELRRLRQQRALEETAGAWRAGDHPDLADGPAIDRWIAEGRRESGWNRDPEVAANHAPPAF